MKKEICKICGELTVLSKHIRKHNLTTKEYYDKYLKKDNEGICPVCNKETKFLGIEQGYAKFCSNKCHANDPESKNNLSLILKNKSLNEKKLIREKQINTWKNNYGENWAKIIANKGFKTYKEKTGYNSPFSDPKIRTKCEEKWNNSSPVNENVKNKISNSLKLYYKESNRSLNDFEKTFLKYNSICKNITKRIDNHYFNYHCDKCNKDSIVNILSIRRIYHNKIYNGNFDNLCKYCNVSLSSNKELELCNFIKQYVPIETRNRTILNGKELDIFIPSLNLAFEFDGTYWHNELFKDKNYHLDKTEECLKNNIQLIHIFEDEWDFKNDIVKSRILGLLNKNNRIFARKTICKEISYKESMDFLNQNHIQGSCMSKYRYGLFYNNELISIMTFGKSRFSNEFELLRFCNKLYTNVIGGASKLFKHFLVDHPEIKEVISYADKRWSNGNLYEKLNFNLINISKPSYFYVIDKIRYNRINFQKHKLINNTNNLSEHDYMFNNKFYRIYDCGSLKYKFVR